MRRERCPDLRFVQMGLFPFSIPPPGDLWPATMPSLELKLLDSHRILLRPYLPDRLFALWLGFPEQSQMRVDAPVALRDSLVRACSSAGSTGSWRLSVFVPRGGAGAPGVTAKSQGGPPLPLGLPPLPLDPALVATAMQFNDGVHVPPRVSARAEGASAPSPVQGPTSDLPSSQGNASAAAQRVAAPPDRSRDKPSGQEEATSRQHHLRQAEYHLSRAAQLRQDAKGSAARRPEARPRSRSPAQRVDSPARRPAALRASAKRDGSRKPRQPDAPPPRKEVANLTSSAGHPLFHVSRVVWDCDCDWCNVRFQKGSQAFACQSCKCTVCNNCFTPTKARPRGQGTSAAASPAPAAVPRPEGRRHRSRSPLPDSSRLPPRRVRTPVRKKVSRSPRPRPPHHRVGSPAPGNPRRSPSPPEEAGTGEARPHVYKSPDSVDPPICQSCSQAKWPAFRANSCKFHCSDCMNRIPTRSNPSCGQVTWDGIWRGKRLLGIGKGFVCTGCWLSEYVSDDERDSWTAWCTERARKYPEYFSPPSHFAEGLC